MTYLDNGEKRFCLGCQGCENVCPKNCISMKEDSEGFWYPSIDMENCIECGKCRKVCPFENKHDIGQKLEKPKVYAAVCLDEDIRFKSSSGGIFTLLAESVIEKNGVVFGAGYDENFKVIHKEAVNKKDLEDLRGSKYVQSYIGDTYKRIKEYLDKNKTVLFCGTPCQVHGLYSFLGKASEGLITCDLICGGTPSPKVFNLYLDYLSRKYGAKIVSIRQRAKDKGWGMFCKIEFSNKKQYLTNFLNDPYYSSFLSKLLSRPACYSCPYTSTERTGDLTLADYWKISQFHPEMNDNRGTSLVIANTEKGHKLFDNCNKSMRYIPSGIEYAKPGNPCLIKSCKQRDDRQMFFNDLQKYSFEKVLRKYMSPSPKLIRFIRRPVYFSRKLISRIIN